MKTPSEEVICEEIYGSTWRKHVYVTSNARKTTQLANSEVPLSIRSSITDVFKSAFLPQGYPDSVSKDYLNYQIWDSIQAFVSRLMGTLSTREVLKGIGVGDENVTVLAATITWLLRDGTSMLARILFAWYESTGLDYNSKQWRLFADVMNDIAIFFDLLASHFRVLSMPILCLAGIFRATVDAAGGATRAAFVQHQARRGNLADVAAKDGSQETLVNLAGLIVSLLVLPLVGNNAVITWVMFIVLTSLHLFANFNAVKSVVLESLNQLRLSILVTRFIEAPNNMPTVEEVNLAEPLILGKSFGKIHLGCSFQKVVSELDNSSIKSCCTLYQTNPYFLVVNTQTYDIFVVLEKGCGTSAEIESSFQAHVLFYYFKNWEKPTIRDMLKPYSEKGCVDQLSLLRWSKAYVDNNFLTFARSLEASGWDTSRTLLGSDEWRAEWKKRKDN